MKSVREEMEEEHRAAAVYEQLKGAYPYEGRRRLCQRASLIVWGTESRALDVAAVTENRHPGGTNE